MNMSAHMEIDLHIHNLYIHICTWYLPRQLHLRIFGTLSFSLVHSVFSLWHFLTRRRVSRRRTMSYAAKCIHICSHLTSFDRKCQIVFQDLEVICLHCGQHLPGTRHLSFCILEPWAKSIAQGDTNFIQVHPSRTTYSGMFWQTPVVHDTPCGAMWRIIPKNCRILAGLCTKKTVPCAGRCQVIPASFFCSTTRNIWHCQLSM